MDINITLERLPTTFQWETGGLLHNCRISNAYGLPTRFARTLCVPMGMHIRMVSLYASMPGLDMLHYPQADHHQLERLLISKPLSTMYDQWFQSNRYLSYANIPSLSLSMDANDHNQLTSPILMSTTPYVCLWVYT